MVGKLPPETVNPVPEIESELMVTAAVPLDVTVTDLETAVPTETLPKASEVALRERDGVAAFNCRAALCEEEFEVAVSVADWAVVTEATVAVKAAVEAPAATVTLAGTVTALSLLASVTTWPPVGAAPDRLTEQESDSAPVIDVLPHETALSIGEVVDCAGFNVIDVVCDALPWEAVSVAVCGESTVAMVAAKVALVAPEGISTEVGTLTALLLLARLTENPALGAGALIFTEQLSLPAPMIEAVEQLRPDREAVVPD